MDTPLPSPVTYADVERLAAKEVAKTARLRGSARRAAGHVWEGLEAATRIILWALQGGEAKSPPAPTDFLHQAARVVARKAKIDAIPVSVWENWPARADALQLFDNMHWTGRSALEVAARIVKTVDGAVQFGRSRVTMNAERARQFAVDPPDERAVRWRDGTLTELAQVTIQALAKNVMPYQFTAARTRLLTDIQIELERVEKGLKTEKQNVPSGEGLTSSEQASATAIVAHLRKIGHPLGGEPLIRAALGKRADASYWGLLARMVSVGLIRSKVRIGKHKGYALPERKETT